VAVPLTKAWHAFCPKKKKGGGRKNSSQGCEKSVDRSVESAETKQQIVCEINRLAAARVVTPRLVVSKKN